MSDGHAASRAPASRSVAMVAFDGAQALDVVGPLEVFACATRLHAEQAPDGEPFYTTIVVAEKPGPIRCSGGITPVAEGSWQALGPVDTCLVAGGAGVPAVLQDDAFVAWLRTTLPQARRYGSVCTGALLLARAGLLDGRRVTTHYMHQQELAEIAPMARVEPDAVFTRDGALWSSAGVLAGMDMALAMVERDLGRGLALEVGRRLGMYPGRARGQKASRPRGEAETGVAQGRFEGLASWVLEHPEAALSINAMAEYCGMSVRHFARLFRAEIGTTPAKFVESVRFDAACEALAGSDDTLAAIASRLGFGSAETFRRLFVRRTGMSPAAYRRRMR
ncbi:MAG: helix-turn-helix domain-containing protein [Gammaproteobacteria bacterium]|jgi:transcriptional regulator GlxA family with amidase domain